MITEHTQKLRRDLERKSRQMRNLEIEVAHLKEHIAQLEARPPKPAKTKQSKP